jgi:hypothetical protein
MMKLSTDTKLDAKEVIKRAVAHFGPDGLGLETEAQDETSVTFKGGGGGIIVEIGPGDKGKRKVDLSSREWDLQARQFIAKIR